MAGFDPQNSIDGHYGAIFHEGNWLANFNKAEATWIPESHNETYKFTML